MTFYRLKRMLSGIVDGAFDLDRWVSSRKGLRVILAYHRVLPLAYISENRVQDAMWVSPETFDLQLEWMTSVGECVSLERILDFEYRSSAPLFCITFDDGWLDNYVHAFPILQRRSLPATIFLATAAVESGKAFWVENLIAMFDSALKKSGCSVVAKLLEEKEIAVSSSASVAQIWRSVDFFLERLKLLSSSEREEEINDVLDRFGFSADSVVGREMMSWSEIEEMADGGVDFQSHTHSHQIMKFMPHDEMSRELVQSKEIIEKNLGRKVNMFCYPNARFPAGDQSDVYRRAGYEYGVKIDNQVLVSGFNPYLIPRFLMNQDNSGYLPYFKFRLLGVPKY